MLEDAPVSQIIMLDTGDSPKGAEKSGMNEIGAFSTQNTEENKADKPDDSDVVYWTEGGTVWHTKRECPSLSRSKKIISGTVDEAISADKERACKKCS